MEGLVVFLIHPHEKFFSRSDFLKCGRQPPYPVQTTVDPPSPSSPSIPTHSGWLCKHRPRWWSKLGPLEEFGCFLNGLSSLSLCNYSTLFLIQLLSSIKRLFLIKFISASMDFWSLGLPWNEPLAIIIDSAVNRLESNGFRDQLWNKKCSGNKQTSRREQLTQTMISRSGNLQNPITRRPLPNQLSAPSSVIVCSNFSSRHKGRRKKQDQTGLDRSAS